MLFICRISPHLAAIAALALSIGSVPAWAAGSGSAAPASPTFAQECAKRLKPTNVQVVVRPTEVRYDYSKSVTELTRMRKTANAAKGRTLGLAHGALTSNVQWQLSSLRADREGCVRPSVTIELAVDPHVVHVAREFPQGSCAFKEILLHEQRHVKANLSHADEVALTMQRELTQWFGQKVFYGDVKTLTAQLNEAVKGHWLSRLDVEMSKVDGKHAHIDTPQEYARNQTLCKGEIPRTLARMGY